jgi:hypothetical protein
MPRAVGTAEADVGQGSRQQACFASAKIGENMYSTGTFLAGLVITILLASTGIIVWIMRSAASQRDRQALALDDLLRLEETVSALIERLKASSDEAVEAMDQRQEQLERVLRLCDRRVQSTLNTESVINKPVANEPMISEPAIGEPAIGEPAISKSVISEPAFSKSVISELETGGPITGESAIDEPNTNETATGEPAVDKSANEAVVIAAPQDGVTDEVEIARRSGMLRGEIDLMIELQSLKQ